MSPCFFPFFGHVIAFKALTVINPVTELWFFFGICYLTLLTQLLKVKSKCIVFVWLFCRFLVLFCFINNEILSTSEND